SAAVMDLSGATEKSGVDFQMRPVAVTHIHGTIVAGSADWRGRNALRVNFAPADASSPRSIASIGEVNAREGTFDITQVFPGSYRLTVFSPNFPAREPQVEATDSVA